MNQEEMNQLVMEKRAALEAANQQRTGAEDKLRSKVSDLLQRRDLSADKLTESVSVDTFRDIIQALNSTLQIVSAQNNLIDSLIHDLTGTYTTVQSVGEKMVETSFTVEAVVRALLEKDLLDKEELDKQGELTNERLTQMRESMKSMPDQSENENT